MMDNVPYALIIPHVCYMALLSLHPIKIWLSLITPMKTVLTKHK